MRNLFLTILSSERKFEISVLEISLQLERLCENEEGAELHSVSDPSLTMLTPQKKFEIAHVQEILSEKEGTELSSVSAMSLTKLSSEKKFETL